jgi:hypothetical protein
MPTTAEQKAKNKINNDKAKAKRLLKAQSQTTIATAVRAKIARTAVKKLKGIKETGAQTTIATAVRAKIARTATDKLRKQKVADDLASAKPTSLTKTGLINLPRNLQRQIVRMSNMNSGSKNDFDENGISVLQNTIKTDVLKKSRLFILNSKAKIDKITKGQTELTYNWTDDAKLPITGGYRTIFDKQVQKYTKGDGVAEGYVSQGKGRFIMFIFNYGRPNPQILFAHEGGETSYPNSPVDYGSPYFVERVHISNRYNDDGSGSPFVLNEARKQTTTDLMKKKKEKYAKMAMMKPSMKMGAK